MTYSVDDEIAVQVPVAGWLRQRRPFRPSGIIHTAKDEMMYNTLIFRFSNQCAPHPQTCSLVPTNSLTYYGKRLNGEFARRV